MKSWILPVLAIVVFAVTRILAGLPDFTEFAYSQGIYPHLASFISFFSWFFPFSLDDLFYFLLILLVFVLIVLLVFKKIRLVKAGKIVLNVFALVFILFYVFWGFNYFRTDLNTRLNINEQKVNTEYFLVVFENLVNQTNKSYSNFESFNIPEIDSLVEESFKNLSPALKLKYPAGKRKAKKITLSNFFGKAGISGYFGPFFSEVHVNSKVLPVEYPFVLAHEKAHQFGVTSEAEANFYAWMVCSQSSSKELQYSGNLALLRYFINQGFRLDGFSEIVKKLDGGVREDYQEIREHWMTLRNEKVDKIATKVNDTYLKTNKVEKGIEDYKGVVKYTMDFSLDTAFQKRYNLPFSIDEIILF
ncbi:DUF3810 domain-containing protein [Maribellus maritimus]|uniref:DUF3810 domain-containing protein n=1 Tax=Maribellus maritimus TaxID=2870838 RepID=UPI001EEC2118|nr:DUF3810 domain-containing protein [Maribellus maritimus]MCG6190903.1 DUF3810 domain-containing protein [Maribellus maritimus]